MTSNILVLEERFQTKLLQLESFFVLACLLLNPRQSFQMRPSDQSRTLEAGPQTFQLWQGTSF